MGKQVSPYQLFFLFKSIENIFPFNFGFFRINESNLSPLTPPPPKNNYQ